MADNLQKTNQELETSINKINGLKSSINGLENSRAKIRALEDAFDELNRVYDLSKKSGKEAIPDDIFGPSKTTIAYKEMASAYKNLKSELKKGNTDENLLNDFISKAQEYNKTIQESIKISNEFMRLLNKPGEIKVVANDINILRNALSSCKTEFAAFANEINSGNHQYDGALSGYLKMAQELLKIQSELNNNPKIFSNRESADQYIKQISQEIKAMWDRADSLAALSSPDFFIAETKNIKSIDPSRNNFDKNYNKRLNSLGLADFSIKNLENFSNKLNIDTIVEQINNGITIKAPKAEPVVKTEPKVEVNTKQVKEQVQEKIQEQVKEVKAEPEVKTETKAIQEQTGSVKKTNQELETSTNKINGLKSNITDIKTELNDYNSIFNKIELPDKINMFDGKLLKLGTIVSGLLGQIKNIESELNSKNAEKNIESLTDKTKALNIVISKYRSNFNNIIADLANEAYTQLLTDRDYDTLKSKLNKDTQFIRGSNESGTFTADKDVINKVLNDIRAPEIKSAIQNVYLAYNELADGIRRSTEYKYMHRQEIDEFGSAKDITEARPTYDILNGYNLSNNDIQNIIARRSSWDKETQSPNKGYSEAYDTNLRRHILDRFRSENENRMVLPDKDDELENLIEKQREEELKEKKKNVAKLKEEYKTADSVNKPLIKKSIESEEENIVRLSVSIADRVKAVDENIAKLRIDRIPGTAELYQKMMNTGADAENANNMYYWYKQIAEKAKEANIPIKEGISISELKEIETILNKRAITSMDSDMLDEFSETSESLLNIKARDRESRIREATAGLAGEAELNEELEKYTQSIKDEVAETLNGIQKEKELQSRIEENSKTLSEQTNNIKENSNSLSNNSSAINNETQETSKESEVKRNYTKEIEDSLKGANFSEDSISRVKARYMPDENYIKRYNEQAKVIGKNIDKLNRESNLNNLALNPQITIDNNSSISNRSELNKYKSTITKQAASIEKDKENLEKFLNAAMSGDIRNVGSFDNLNISKYLNILTSSYVSNIKAGTPEYDQLEKIKDFIKWINENSKTSNMKLFSEGDIVNSEKLLDTIELIREEQERLNRVKEVTENTDKFKDQYIKEQQNLKDLEYTRKYLSGMLSNYTKSSDPTKLTEYNAINKALDSISPSIYGGNSNNELSAKERLLEAGIKLPQFSNYKPQLIDKYSMLGINGENEKWNDKLKNELEQFNTKISETRNKAEKEVQKLRDILNRLKEDGLGEDNDIFVNIKGSLDQLESKLANVKKSLKFSDYDTFREQAKASVNNANTIYSQYLESLRSKYDEIKNHFDREELINGKQFSSVEKINYYKEKLEELPKSSEEYLKVIKLIRQAESEESRAAEEEINKRLGIIKNYVQTQEVLTGKKMPLAEQLEYYKALLQEFEEGSRAYIEVLKLVRQTEANIASEQEKNINDAKNRLNKIINTIQSVASAINKAVNKIISIIRAAFNYMNKIISMAGKVVTAVKTGITNIISLFGNFGNRLRSAGKETGIFNNELSILKGSFTELRSKLMLLKGAFNTVFNNQMVSKAKNLLGSIYSMKNIMGSELTDEVLNWANSMEYAFGLSARSLIGDINELTGVLYGLGMSAKDTAIGSENILMMSRYLGFMGAAGGNVSQVMSKLNSGMKGMTQAIDDLGLSVREAQMDSYLKGLKKQGGEFANIGTSFSRLNEQARVYVRYSSLIKQFTDKYDITTFAKALDTTTGKLSILNQTWESFYTKIGQGLAVIAALIAEYIIPIIRVIDEEVEGLFLKISEFLGIADEMKNGLGLFNNSNNDKAIDDVNDKLKETNDELKDVEDNSKKASNSMQSFDKVNNMTTKDSDSEDAFDYSSLMNTALDDLNDYAKESDNFFVKLKNKFDERIESAKEKIKQFFKDVTGRENIDFGFDTDKIKENLKQIKDNILNTIKGWGTFFISIGLKIADDINLGNLLTKISTIISKASEALEKLSNILEDALGDLYDKYLAPIFEKLGKDSDSFLDGIIKILDEINEDLDKEETREKIRKFINEDVVNKIKEALEIAGQLGRAITGNSTMKDLAGDNKGWSLVLGIINNISLALQDIGKILKDIITDNKDVLVNEVLPWILQKTGELLVIIDQNRENIQKLIETLARFAWDNFKIIVDAILKVLKYVVEHVDDIQRICDILTDISHLAFDDPVKTLQILLGLKIASWALNGAAAIAKLVTQIGLLNKLGIFGTAGAAGAAGETAAGGTAVAGGLAAKIFGTGAVGGLSTGGTLIAAGAAALGIKDVADSYNKELTDEQKLDKAYSGVGRLGTLGVGMATGASIGSFVGPIGTLGGAIIGGVIGGLISIFKGADIGKWMQDTAVPFINEKLKPALKEVIESSINGIKESFNSIGENIQKFFNKFRDDGNGVIDNNYEVIGEYIKSFGLACKDFGEFVVGLANGVVDLINKGIEIVKGLVYKGINLFEGLFGDAIKSIVDAVGNIWNNFIKWIEQKALDVGQWITNLFTGQNTAISASEAMNMDMRATKARKIYSHAAGGSIASGQLFIANENGQPELIGNIDNTSRTNVANNNMIIQAMTDGVFTGVYNAIAEANNQRGNINSQSTNIKIDGFGLIDQSTLRKLAMMIAPYISSNNINIADLGFSI